MRAHLDIDLTIAEQQCCSRLAATCALLAVCKFRQYQADQREYIAVGECVQFLFTSCEGSLNERVSAANE